MSRKSVGLLLLVLLLWPGAAGAEAPTLTLAEYQARLDRAVQLLESGDTRGARELVGGAWTVQTPGGPVQATLRPVAELLDAPGNQAEALTALRQHQEAAALAARTTYTPDPAAREDLARILEMQKARRTWLERLDNWLRRLFGESEIPAGAVNAAKHPATVWIVGAVGALGLAVFIWSLYRNMSGYAIDGDVKAGGLRGPRPEHALTPDELWRHARALSEQGDHREALRLGYLALLQHFDHKGLIRYIPAQTNREHERQLRRKHPEMARSLTGLTNLVEARLYAGQDASANDFAHGANIIEQLWREGDAASKSAGATTAASSSAPSR